MEVSASCRGRAGLQRRAERHLGPPLTCTDCQCILCIHIHPLFCPASPTPSSKMCPIAIGDTKGTAALVLSQIRPSLDSAAMCMCTQMHLFLFLFVHFSPSLHHAALHLLCHWSGYCPSKSSYGWTPGIISPPIPKLRLTDQLPCWSLGGPLYFLDGCPI